MTNKIRYRPIIGTASGRRTGWVKHVTSVDPDATNGYGVHGEFLRAGKEVELPAGAVILRVDPEGSVRRAWQSARVFRLVEGGAGDGKPVGLAEGEPNDELDWNADFLQVRDLLVKALGEQPVSPLVDVPIDDLIDEIARRAQAAGVDFSAVVNGRYGDEDLRRRAAERS